MLNATKERLTWFKAQKLKPGFDYRVVWLKAHRAAFTVARMTNLDLLKKSTDAN